MRLETAKESEPVELERFPYPYQAAFTVASDIDSASIQRFAAVHALFCGRQLIREGSPEWEALKLKTTCRRFSKAAGGIPGLGFDFADSFFLIGDASTFGMYRYLPEEDRFREDEQQGRSCAELIRSWFKQGAIDCFHAFLHYTRQQVEPLLNEFYVWCEHEGLEKPSVWMNHSCAVTPSGLCPARLQPKRVFRLARLTARYVAGPLFGRKRHPLRFAFVRYWGDTPHSPYYVNDLLAANGLRFVWLNSAESYHDQIALPEQQMNGRPTILRCVTMDDGIRYYQFPRCYGRPLNRTNDVAYLRDCKEGFDSSRIITEKNLQELCRANGTSILYTHWTHLHSMPIGDETIARFELLRRWQEAGKIWVTSTARLLEWTRRRTFLRLSYSREGKKLIVAIEGVDDPVFGPQRLALEDLHGLCLRLRNGETTATVALNGRALGPGQVHRAGNLCWLNAGHRSPRAPHRAVPQEGSVQHGSF